MEENLEYDGFDDYEVSTVDPGPILLVAVVLVPLSFFLLMTLTACCCKSPWEMQLRSHQEETTTGKGEVQNREEQKPLISISFDGQGTVHQECSASNNSLDYGTSTQQQQQQREAAEIADETAIGHSKSEESEQARHISSMTPRRPSSGTFHRFASGGARHRSPQDHRSSIRSLSIRLSASSRSSVLSDGELDEEGDPDPNVAKFFDETTTTFQKFGLVVCNNCDTQSQRILKLLGPYVSQSLISAACEIIELALVGHKLSTSALSAYVIVDLLVRLTSDFVGSVISAGNTLISQIAEREDDAAKAGRYLQLSLMLYGIGYLPCVVMWAFCMDKVLMFLGYDDNIAEVGRQFAIPYAVAALLHGIGTGFQYMLDVVGHEMESTWMTAITEVGTTSVVAVFLCWERLFPHANLVSLGYVYALCSCVYFFSILITIRKRGWLEEHMEGFTAFRLFYSEGGDPARVSNYEATCLILLNASSLGFAMLLYHGEWQILIFFASWLGPAEVAAWGLLGTIWDANELIIEAVSEACEVRCAMFLGTGQVKQAKFLAYKSYWIGFVSAAIISLFLFLFIDVLPTWLTRDELLRQMIEDLIPMICIANFASGMMIVSETMLYAQNRYKLATAIACCVTMFVTLPLAALSSIVYHINLEGQTAAVVVGISLTGALTMYTVVKSDWKSLSDAIISSHEYDDLSHSSADQIYDDMYWDELPPKVKKAAETLGYTQSAWDKDENVPAGEKDWMELTTKEKAAAIILGYSEQKWDDGSSDDS